MDIHIYNFQQNTIETIFIDIGSSNIVFNVVSPAP